MLVLVGRSTNDGASVQEDATTDGKLAAAAIEAVFVCVPAGPVKFLSIFCTGELARFQCGPAE